MQHRTVVVPAREVSHASRDSTTIVDLAALYKEGFFIDSIVTTEYDISGPRNTLT